MAKKNTLHGRQIEKVKAAAIEATPNDTDEAIAARLNGVGYVSKKGTAITFTADDIKAARNPKAKKKTSPGPKTARPTVQPPMARNSSFMDLLTSAVDLLGKDTVHKIVDGL